MTFIKLRGEVGVTGEGVERARDEGRPPKPPPPINAPDNNYTGEGSKLNSAFSYHYYYFLYKYIIFFFFFSCTWDMEWVMI